MKKHIKKSALPVEEWNFSSCPERERATCLHYEYAREYVQFRPDLLPKLTGTPRPSPYNHPLTFIYSNKRHPDCLPMICSDFPAVPWLKLPVESRSSLIARCQPLPEDDPLNSNLLVSDDFDFSLIQKLADSREKLFSQWKQEVRDQHDREISGLNVGLLIEEQPVERSGLCDGPKHFYALREYVALALIELNWLRSDRQLKAAFGRLLKLRPKPANIPDKKRLPKGGRGAASDQLKQLGARRLLAHCGTPDAAIGVIEVAYKNTRNKPPYSDPDALREAAAKAGKVLKDFEFAGRFRAFSDL